MTRQDRLNEIRRRKEEQFKIFYAAQAKISELELQYEKILSEEED